MEKQCIIDGEFSQILRRFDKLKNSFESLIREKNRLNRINATLRKTNESLLHNYGTEAARWDAELRIAKEEIEKQVRTENTGSVKES